MPTLSMRSVHRHALWAAVSVLLGGLVVGFVLWKSHAPATPSERLVGAGPASSFHVHQPKAFSKDGFDLIRLDDGRFVALYVYPPGYFGHAQGCTIRWNPVPNLDSNFHEPALWMEGCGGALWDPSGHYLFGPSRDLDQFPVTVHAGHVFVDTRQLQCPNSSAAYPCERVQGPVTQVFVTVTNNGFQPSRVELPAGRPAYVILKNDTTVAQSWHVVGVPDAADNASRWPLPPIPAEATFADGSDIHVVVPPDEQFGRPFTVATRGTYTFVSDAAPGRLHGTLVVH
jgi:hypothetical protein